MSSGSIVAVEEILATGPPPPADLAHPVGLSRLGREILGWRIGHGARSVSLIGGAHADEPVGPMTLARLVAWLCLLPPDHPLLVRWRWSIVPDINPDGAAVNEGWASRTAPTIDSRGVEDRGYLLSAYLLQAVRERPGDDLEFGFPRQGPGRGREVADDPEARPEARSVAGFLRAGAPFVLHASLHSMGFASGPWFLLDRAWIGRTEELRRRVANRTHSMGYQLYDVDRKGEKGFTRIAEGFCTRPDSESMRQYFLDRHQPEVAALFRPSSMELARSLGGDPLTIVSEMPLFLAEASPGNGVANDAVPLPIDLESRRSFHAWAQEVVREEGGAALDRRALAAGVRPMPIRDQMRLQLHFLDAALATVRDSAPTGD